jgi:diguanylate cyclase (GGDEF)-like protein/PAS domain S-box-containing protein
MLRTIISSLVCLILLVVLCPPRVSSGDFLSPEEQEWLRKMDGKIRVAPDPHYPPMEFFDEDGNFQGIAADYVRIIEQKLDIRFEIVRLGDFEEIIDKAAAREIDMVNTVIQTPERSRFLSFTSPYIQISNVIVVSDNISANLSVKDLKEFEDVVYQGGYSIGPYLMEEHGLYHMRPVADPSQALIDLSTGRIQAMVGNLGVISYYIHRLNLPNLRVAGDCGFQDVLSFASRNDWPIFSRILDKALEDISPDVRRAIKDEWIGLSLPRFYQDPMFWLSLSGLVLFFLLLLVLFYFWNQSLKKQVDLRTQAHKQALDDFADEVLRRKVLVEQSRDGIVVLNDQGGVYEANKQFADMLGYKMEECERLHIWDWDSRWTREELLNMVSSVDAAGDNFETRFRRKDGSMLDVEISTNGATIKGKKYVFCVCRDITQRKKDEEEIRLKNEQLREMAMTDDLTGLNNRRFFFLRGEGEIQRARRFRTPLSLLMIDLDHFKNINDTLGHEAGDKVLRCVASIIQDNIRQIDILARLGGEEFGVLLPNTDAQEAAALAERLRVAVEQAGCRVQEQTVYVTVSIGIDSGRDDDLNLDSLLSRADDAMYQAKSRSRNQTVVMER